MHFHWEFHYSWRHHDHVHHLPLSTHLLMRLYPLRAFFMFILIFQHSRCFWWWCSRGCHSKGEPYFLQIIPPASLMDDETFPEGSGSLSDRKTSISTNTPDVLSVNQLIESVCIASMPHFGVCLDLWVGRQMLLGFCLPPNIATSLLHDVAMLDRNQCWIFPYFSLLSCVATRLTILEGWFFFKSVIWGPTYLIV